MAPYVLEYNSDGVLNLGRGVICLFCSEKGSQTAQHSSSHVTQHQIKCLLCRYCTSNSKMTLDFASV